MTARIQVSAGGTLTDGADPPLSPSSVSVLHVVLAATVDQDCLHSVALVQFGAPHPLFPLPYRVYRLRAGMGIPYDTSDHTTLESALMVYHTLAAHALGCSVPDPSLELATPEAARCAAGIHSWVDQQGKLPPSTKCAHCPELYGHPD